MASAAREYWDSRILAWERARYSALARANPLSWTVRARLAAAESLLAGELSAPRRVLELGCGTGRLAAAVAADPGRSYLGVDFAPAAVSAARERFAAEAPRVSFECRDALEAAAEPADLAVFLGLTDWLAPEALERLFSGLAAGRLLFSFTEERSAFSPLYAAYRRRADGELRARSWPERELLAALARAGYRPARVIRSLRLGPGRLVLAERP